jgi:hypothetical protein
MEILSEYLVPAIVNPVPKIAAGFGFAVLCGFFVYVTREDLFYRHSIALFPGSHLVPFSTTNESFSQQSRDAEFQEYIRQSAVKVMQIMLERCKRLTPRFMGSAPVL